MTPYMIARQMTVNAHTDRCGTLVPPVSTRIDSQTLRALRLWVGAPSPDEAIREFESLPSRQQHSDASPANADACDTPTQPDAVYPRASHKSLSMLWRWARDLVSLGVLGGR